ncbi:MAG: hypothetical protein R3F60_15645 [bacterium]
MRGFILGVLVLVAGCDDGQAPPFDPSAPPGVRVTDAGVLYDAQVDARTSSRRDRAVDPDTRDLGPEVDSAAFEQVPFAVETRVGDRRTPAGLSVRVGCEVLDQQGEPIPGLRTVVEVRPDHGFTREDEQFTGEIARDYELICTAPDHGLRDRPPRCGRSRRRPRRS